MNFRYYIYVSFITLFFAACKTVALVEYKAAEIKVVDEKLSSPDIAKYIAVYHDSLDREMSEVIAENKILLTKRQPESTLGNLLVDAIFEETQALVKQKIDVAIVNNGGIRLPQLPAGAITTGKVYELMPFDNMVVILNMSGKELQQFCNIMAAFGGWPIAGATYIIENKKATQLKINGELISSDKNYRIAISDYLANGGDKLEMLINKPQENTGVLLRDMFLSYFKRKKVLVSTINGRVIIQNDTESE